MPSLFVSISIGAAFVVSLAWWEITKGCGLCIQQADKNTHGIYQMAVQAIWQSFNMGYTILQSGMDIALILVLSQEITRNRDSPMYINSEYAYTLPIICIIFILSSVFIKDEDEENNHKFYMRSYLCILMLGFVSYIVILSYTPEPYDYSRRLSAAETIVPFLSMTIIYLVPASHKGMYHLPAPRTNTYRIICPYTSIGMRKCALNRSTLTNRRIC